MRIGVLSDLHCDATPKHRSWINEYDYANLDARIDLALEAFRSAGIDLVAVPGDLTETGDEAMLSRIIDRLRAVGAPVAIVAGNHDASGGSERFERRASETSARLPAREAFILGNAAVTGVGVEPLRLGSAVFRATGVSAAGHCRVRVLLSHFPLLSEASRLAGAGLPYPGDLTNREQIADEANAADSPVIVLSGHIHSRCSRAEGSILQLGSGALIEPPFDCAIVDISDLGPLKVERRSQRLGPQLPLDPVFANDHELWQWQGDQWSPLPASATVPGA
jgi:calcineurin-like phosphoesterase family protein